MSRVVEGLCEDFCPRQESKLRIREKLLHYYEFKNGEKVTPGTLIKAFSRSAAGVIVPGPKDLRTESCLQQTIEYLLEIIIVDRRKPYSFIYDFIFDRLRAVRQEIVIQNYNARKSIKILQPIIMFLAYSRYRLCQESIDHFDPQICDQHLQECLKRVLCCYDEIDVKELKTKEMQNRNFIESLYQIFNVGSIEALKRGSSLPTIIRNDTTFKKVFSIGMSYHQGNIYRVLKGMADLPHIICALGSLKMQNFRRKLFEIFAHAYNSKQLTVPVVFLCRLTHQTMLDLREQCKYYDFPVTKDSTQIQFVKNKFRADVQTPKAIREYYVDEKLKNLYISDVLLLKKL